MYYMKILEEPELFRGFGTTNLLLELMVGTICKSWKGLKKKKIELGDTVTKAFWAPELSEN